MVLTGVGLLGWPRVEAPRRLRALTRRAGSIRPAGRSRLLAALVGAVFGVTAAYWSLGLAGAVAFAFFTAAARAMLRARSRTRAAASSAESMAEALRTLVAELRAGTHPAAAAETAAVDAEPATARVLTTIAGAERLGGDAEPAFPAGADSHRPVVEQLLRAWSLARRHGLPLAELLDSVRREVEQGARLTAQSQAMMAGPRASATVLALLPVAGVALGEVMGAGPLLVLAESGTGQVLLVLGSALICAGVAWSARLTSPGDL